MAHTQLSLILRHIRKLAGDSKATDRQLLDRFATQHEEAAFEMLLERHGPAVLGVCRRVLRHEQDAEDVFQATFLTLARKASSIRKPESLPCWLYGVASRLAFKVRAKRKIARLIREPVEPSAGQELCAALDEELNGLAWRFQAPIVLCYLEGKTREVAARQLGWSVGTLKLRLNQGREILRQRLTRRGLTLSAVLTAVGLSQETVPAALVISTAKGAMTFVAGTAVGIAAELAEGALKGMLLIKLKIGATLVLAVSTVALGAGLIAHQVQPGGPESPSGVAKPEAPVQAKAFAEPMPMMQAARPVEIADDPLPAQAVLRLGTERFRHGHSITSLGFDFDGKRIVATDSSGAYLWDASTGRQLRRIGGDLGTRWFSASLSANGQRLATWNGGRTLHVWDVDSGELIQDFDVDGFAILSADGSLVASCAKGIIHLWDIARGKELRSWVADTKGVHRFTFSPDGKVLVTGGQDKVIHVWEVSTGKEVRSLRGHSDEVGNVVFSPDGRILTSVGCTKEEFKQDNGIAWVWHADNKVHMWDFESGKEIRQLAVPREDQNSKQGKYANEVINMVFAHDGRTLATVVYPLADKAIRIWDMVTGKELRGFGPPLSACLAFSRDDRILATAGSNMIRLWDARSGQEHELTKGPQGPIRGLAVSPNGRLVASASDDGTVRLWEAATGKELRCFTGPGEAYAVTFSPDGHKVASSGKDKTIRLWDVATGQVICPLQGDQSVWSSPLFTPDGKTLACSSFEGVLCLWNTATGERVREWKGAADCLAFSPDGKMLYSCAEEKVRVWDTATGKEIRQFDAGHAHRNHPVAFAPNGKWVACWAEIALVLVYDLATGAEVQRLEAPGTPSCLAFSPDSRTLAWGGWNGEPIVLLLEVASNQIRHRFAGHRGPINALIFWPDGKLLASGCQDTTTLIWDLLGSSHLPRQDTHLSVEALRACWADLASLDGSTGYDAMCKLVAAPRESVSFLAQRLSEVPRDSTEQFLHQTLERRPSAWVRQRVSDLLEKTKKRQGASEWLQGLRAVEALENIATPEAREVLQKLAKGAPEARLTQEARASLERLAKQSALGTSSR